MLDILFGILIVVAGSAVLLWLVGLLWTWRALKQQQPLPIAKSASAAPLVSILLPARNEEHRVLPQAVRSLARQDYENFEIIALNDRSIDRTAEILRGSAVENKKLLVIDGTELPHDWLGKSFALQQAFERARGEWILATDADIIFSPCAVTTAINHCLANNLDALTLIPRVVCLSFWERVFMPVFGWFCLLAMPPAAVNDPDSPKSMGVGNFFLIRRRTLEKIGGYRAVKADVAEDLRMAEILKKNRASLRVEFAPDLIETRMYSGVREIWDGFTKNFFAGSQFSVFKALFGAYSVILLGVLPIVAAVGCLILRLLFDQPQLFWLFVLSAVLYVLQIALFLRLAREWRIAPVYAVFAPAGFALFAAILINSTARILTGRGVTWKGRAIYERGGIRPPAVNSE